MQPIDLELIVQYCKYLDVFNAPKEQVCYLPLEKLVFLSQKVVCTTPTGDVVSDFLRDAKIKGVPAYQMILNTCGYVFHFIASEKSLQSL